MSSAALSHRLRRITAPPARPWGATPSKKTTVRLPALQLHAAGMESTSCLLIRL